MTPSNSGSSISFTDSEGESLHIEHQARVDLFGNKSFLLKCHYVPRQDQQ